MKNDSGVIKLLSILGSGYLLSGIAQGVQQATRPEPVKPVTPPGPLPQPVTPGAGGGSGPGVPSLGDVAAAIGGAVNGAMDWLGNAWDAFSGWINPDTSNLTYNSPIYTSPIYPAGGSDVVTAPQPAYPVLDIPGVTVLGTETGPRTDEELVNMVNFGTPEPAYGYDWWAGTPNYEIDPYS